MPATQTLAVLMGVAMGCRSSGLREARRFSATCGAGLALTAALGAPVQSQTRLAVPTTNPAAAAPVGRAEAALASGGDDAATADALMDGLVAAVVSDDRSAAGRFTRAILFDHPDSLPAGYLVASRTPDDLRVIFEGLPGEDWFDPTPEALRRFAAAVRRPVERHGTTLFGTDRFALEAALMMGAAATTDGVADAESLNEGVSAIRQRFEKASGDNDLRGVALACLAPGATPGGVLESLSAFRDRNLVAPWELWFLHRLPPERRADPAVLRREAMARVYAGPEGGAAAAFDRLAEAGGVGDARTAYLRGLMRLYAGDPAGAAEQWRATAETYPGDEWAVVSAELAAVAPQVAANQQRLADALFALSGDAGRRMAVSEFRVTADATAGQGGEGFAVYAGFGPASADGRLVLAGRTVARARVRGETLELRLGDEPIAERWAVDGVRPNIAVTIGESEGGRPLLKYDVGIRAGGNPAAATPVVSLSATDRPAIATLLEPSRNGLPGPISVEAGRTTFTWLRPPTEPLATGGGAVAVKRTPYTLDEGGTLAGEVDLDRMAIAFRVGPAGSFVPDPPPWPDVPTVDRGEMDGPGFMALISKLGATFGPAVGKVME